MTDNTLCEHSDLNGSTVLDKIKEKRAKSKLLDFIHYTNDDYEANWHHKVICSELDDFMRDPNRDRLMVFVGPRRGKSEIVSRRFPAYFLGHNPDAQIIATSYGADLAQGMNRDVQRIIDSPEYRKLFPETTLSGKNVKTTSMGSYIRTSDKFEIVGRRGAYRSAGVGGGITGMGADLALIDDPLKDMAEAMSATRKRVIWDWYASTLYTRLSKIGKVIIILTRWAEDDLAGRLLAEAKANPEADQWEVLCFPEEYEENHPNATCHDTRTEEGELLWPEWFPEDKIRKTKASVGSRVWNSLFQQRPAAADGIICKLSWINYFQALPTFERIAVSVDCTFKDTDGTDYVVMGVIGIAGPDKYLLHLIRERMDIIETLANIKRIHQLFPNISYTLIEDKANGSAVISMLSKEIAGVIPFNPGRDSKTARFTAVAPQIEAGNLFLPDKYYEGNREKFPWVNNLLDIFVGELTMFPNGTHDDCVDMITQLFLKENSSSSWFDSMYGEDETVAQQTEEEKLAALMGWNI